MKIPSILIPLIFIILSFQSCNHRENRAASSLIDLNSFDGKVVAIKDGDTFVVLEDKQQIIVRLSDIDCPEKKQPFGNKAKQFASDLCFGKEVTVRRKGRNDRYGRLIGEVFVGDLCVNKEMVRNGFAWHFTTYSHDKNYADLEQSARNSKLGIWSEPNATPPWQWRGRKKSTDASKEVEE